MSAPKIATQTDDIWIPPGVGYTDNVKANMSIIVEVDEAAASSFLLWAHSEVRMLPGAGTNFFTNSDWAQHLGGSEMTLDIIKLDDLVGVGVAGEIAAETARRRTARMGRDTGRR